MKKHKIGLSEDELREITNARGEMSVEIREDLSDIALFNYCKAHIAEQLIEGLTTVVVVLLCVFCILLGFYVGVNS